MYIASTCYNDCVCVCISEFLSLYETERLVQELTRLNMDIRTIVVNQFLYPQRNTDGSQCDLCNARSKIQSKYYAAIEDLYANFHVIKLPLLPREVCGVEHISNISQWLVKPYSITGG